MSSWTEFYNVWLLQTEVFHNHHHHRTLQRKPSVSSNQFLPSILDFYFHHPVCAPYCGLVWSLSLTESVPGTLDRLRRSQAISALKNDCTEKAFWSFLGSTWQEESEEKQKMQDFILANTALQVAQHLTGGERLLLVRPKCYLGRFSRYKKA